jgi:hypothetical protein
VAFHNHNLPSLLSVALLLVEACLVHYVFQNPITAQYVMLEEGGVEQGTLYNNNNNNSSSSNNNKLKILVILVAAAAAAEEFHSLFPKYVIVTIRFT